MSWSVIPSVQAGTSWNKEQFTLTPTDIANQYVDLAHLITPESLTFNISGTTQSEGTDYNITTAGSVSRVGFLAPLVAMLNSGDVINVQYQF